MRAVISGSFGRSLALRAANQAAAWATENSATWLMCSASIFTASASGFRRWPLQTSQAVLFWYVARRSEEHTSELQSLMRLSYVVFGLQNNSHSQPLTNIHYSHAHPQ